MHRIHFIQLEHRSPCRRYTMSSSRLVPLLNNAFFWSPSRFEAWDIGAMMVRRSIEVKRLRSGGHPTFVLDGSSLNEEESKHLGSSFQRFHLNHCFTRSPGGEGYGRRKRVMRYDLAHYAAYDPRPCTGVSWPQEPTLDSTSSNL